MKINKLLNLLLILTPLAGYIEWGKNNNSFLYEAELEALINLFFNPSAAVHPFTLLPILGQLILIYTLFQQEPNKKLTFIGIACIAVLLLFIFIIGILSINLKILLSTVPFFATGTITTVHYSILKKRSV